MTDTATLTAFERDGVRLTFQHAGAGPLFVFQHGLGGDHRQTSSLVRPCETRTRLTLDCRGHGASDLGEPRAISFETFARDLLALLTKLHTDRVVLGGISMGAALALACACHRDRALEVDALILVRPAWGADVMSEPALTLYREIVRLLRSLAPTEAAEQFKRNPLFRETARTSPAAAASLLGHFEDPRATDLVEVFDRLPNEAPVSTSALRALRIPTLIVATDRDPVHPSELAHSLADAIGPYATVAQVTAKSTDARRYQGEAEQHVSDFLDEHASLAS